MSCFYASPEHLLTNDQNIFAFFDKHFRQRKLTTTWQRRFMCDFEFALTRIAEDTEDPRSFLRVIGICIFNDRLIGLQREVLSKFICYDSRSIRNALYRNGWMRITDKECIPKAFMEADTGRYWSFYRVPEECPIFKLISRHECLISVEDIAAPRLQVPNRPLKNLFLSFT